MKKGFLFRGSAMVLSAGFIVLTALGAFTLNSSSAVSVLASSEAPAVPAAIVNDVVILAGREAGPNDFLVFAGAEANGIAAEFTSPEQIDFAYIGRQDVMISLTRDGQTTFAPAALYILEPAEFVELGAGEPAASLNPRDFLADGGIVGPRAVFDVRFVSGISSLNTTITGHTQTVELTLAGAAFQSLVRIVEAPPEPEPVFTGLPRIVGARSKEVRVGDPLLFSRGVRAENGEGNPLPFTWDASGVDINTPGVYSVTYSAADENGMIAEVTIRVYVVEVDAEFVLSRAEDMLSRILRGSMTYQEQAQSINDWIAANIAYLPGASLGNMYEAAYQVMRHRRGDSLAIRALSTVMFDSAGIPHTYRLLEDIH